ncbi:hypothetical protein H8A95_08910 [Bradyrhizobium sp. Pear76]|uniref:hypothetical protein n=1 Tax=Bradyrhizobium oropedii TaxID=1571201 RepID=UPI001E4AA35D|nr:hypothetical protein [Bradyrhizobium oropedii]MCC8962437.1 hypothetical protein [Bradyrhizobium oropedii]
MIYLATRDSGRCLLAIDTSWVPASNAGSLYPNPLREIDELVDAEHGFGRAIGIGSATLLL